VYAHGAGFKEYISELLWMMERGGSLAEEDLNLTESDWKLNRSEK
jgi:hypothetical protein